MLEQVLRHVTQGVQVWEQQVVIPTYPTGKPDKNPMFLEKRVYQGSSGKVYPHSVIDKIGDEKEDRAYRALCLENEYLFVMVLPELGGRIQRAYDKTSHYDFVYYNHVIKPALVGLTGPWISGGIEFNWPQHHRPSTFDPVASRLAENADGSCTIWVSEIENMFRTKGMAGFTLHPGKAYIQIDVRIYNRTSVPQTFLWWANPAVPVNDHTQSVFPPDVTAVLDHGKRDVSKFPIATGTYYKHDYSAGVDISRYKNIPVPTSYMACRSDYDFVGGYDYEKEAGILHVADHHISPGKKQWTWGCGDFGQAWDRNLTDDDGPYIELMTGCFTDNQPDFAWLAPFEEKTFTQYFLPYKGVGLVKNATVEAALSLSVEDGAARVSVYASAAYPGAKITLRHGAQTLLETACDLSPATSVTESVPTELPDYELSASVYDCAGRLLVEYQPKAPELVEIPAPAVAVPLPADAATNEDLFLYGQHLEQYRHATYQPEDYYTEGLRRDPTDARINNAYGLLLLRRGCFEEARGYFRAAVKKLTRSNPNPYDGEPLYNLGLCEKLLGCLDSAYDSLYKATWNSAWQDAAFYQLACIAARKGDFHTALNHVECALLRGAHNMKARALKTALCRRLGRKEQAVDTARGTLAVDNVDYAARYELARLEENAADLAALLAEVGEQPNWAIEFALEYSDAGLYEEAVEILSSFAASREEASVYPLVYYHLAACLQALGQSENAAQARARAGAACSDYCFPHRLEDLLVLQSALGQSPVDAKGWYYLGNLWYDKRQYAQAVSCWERCRSLDEGFPTAHRNLSLAYYNKLGRPEEARASMERAFMLDETDARVMMELDQLYKKSGSTAKERLQFFEAHADVVRQRDDLYLEYATLYYLLNEPEHALSLIEARKFHPWEGGEGKVPALYIACLVALAQRHLEQGGAEKALELLQRATVYPHNLGEGKLAGAQENNVYYFMGKAHRAIHDEAAAHACFEKAALGLCEPAGMMYYNDQPPEMIFYQGLALLALGRCDEARGRFNRLVSFGEKHLRDHITIDYFAVSLPDLLIFDEDLDCKNRVHCLFMLALGHMGLGNARQAEAYLCEAQTLAPNHLGILAHRGFQV